VTGPLRTAQKSKRKLPVTTFADRNINFLLFGLFSLVVAAGLVFYLYREA